MSPDIRLERSVAPAPRQQERHVSGRRLACAMFIILIVFLPKAAQAMCDPEDVCGGDCCVSDQCAVRDCNSNNQCDVTYLCSEGCSCPLPPAECTFYICNENDECELKHECDGGCLCPDWDPCTSKCDCNTYSACVCATVECTSESCCDDSNPCTDDSCVDGACQHTNNTATCDDGVFCNGVDTCSGGNCSVHPGGPCPGPVGDADCAETCDGAAAACTANDTNGSACDDGNDCTDDTCFGGMCIGTDDNSNACNDGNPCTDDACLNGNCVNTPNNSNNCDDGLYCTGTESCNGGICDHSGDPCAGPDGDTDCSETCDEATDSCSGNDPDESGCGTDRQCCGGTCCEVDECCFNGSCVSEGANCTTGPDQVCCGGTCCEAGYTCDQQNHVCCDQQDCCEIEKLQYDDPDSGYIDVPGTLYVHQGTTVTFKAIGTDPFPSGKPVWGGSSGASGTGATKAVTFNTLSSSTSDYKTVTATCGNTVTANVIVFDFEGEFTPDDNFAGRSQTDYGLEEIVHLDFTTDPTGVTASQAGGLEWTKTGVGNLTGAGNDGTATYDAQHVTGGVTFTLTIKAGPSKNDSKPYDKTVIAPSGTRMTRYSANVWHLATNASAGIALWYWLDPKDVSFKNLEFGEDAAPTINDAGCWLGWQAHQQNTFGAINGGNIADGCRVKEKDQAYAQHPNWGNGGTFTWSIPTQYIDDTGTRTTFGNNQVQTHVTQANGDACQSKGGHSGCAQFGPPASGF